MFLSTLATRIRLLFSTPAKRRLPRRAASKSSSTAACVQSLEPRVVMSANAVTATLSAGVLKVNGTEGKDWIHVWQSNSGAGSIGVEGVKISVNGRLQDTVALRSVSKIEVKAGGGDDVVTLEHGGRAGVTKNATIWGGDGNDFLVGGAANDTLYGNAGEDYLQGREGNDYLSGGTAGASGATLAERDKFSGGEGFDKYNDAFNLNQWVVDGATPGDVDQEGTPTCATLSTLAAAAWRNLDFTAPKITNLGGGNYSVKLYNNGRAEYETVRFDGTWSDNDPSPTKDNDGYVQPEFWTILMHRARMEHFYGIDWSREMTDAAWNAADRRYGGLFNTETAMKQMHGWKGERKGIASVSIYDLNDALNRGDLVVASTPDSSGRIDPATGLVAQHAYAVTKVFQNSAGQLFVRVYNPWGSDGKGTPRDGVNDGYVTLTWSEFSKNFDSVVFGR